MTDDGGHVPRFTLNPYSHKHVMETPSKKSVSSLSTTFAILKNKRSRSKPAPVVAVSYYLYNYIYKYIY